MKYVAIIDSKDELSEETIKKIKSTLFWGDGKSPYCLGPIIRSIKQAPEKGPVLIPCEYRENDYANGYNQALRDCGILKDEN